MSAGQASSARVLGLAAATLIAALVACGEQIDVPNESALAASRPGDIHSVERVRYYPAVAGRAMLRLARLPVPMAIEHGATLYRVEYGSTGPQGEVALASGLVALPRATSIRGVVSYQHPTTTARSDVPSAPSSTATLTALVFAGRGYIVTAPDYLGLGTSPGPHPYLHAETEAAAVVDLLTAARILAEQRGLRWPGLVFLTGFSQGGHATLAAHRALEAEPVAGLEVGGSAAIAGTYNLSGVQFPHALGGSAESHSAYLAYLVTSYAELTGQELSTVLAPPFADSVHTLLDGSTDLRAVSAALPRDPRALFTAEFLRSYEAGEDSWLMEALRANDVHDWTPRAPIRLYYGAADLDSSPEDALRAAERLSAGGGSVATISMGDTNHEQTVYVSIPRVRTWFDSLSASARQ